MNAARVLIAEDESLAAGELRERLERMGLMVTAVVNSGVDAIDRAEQSLPDLVIMDTHLKGEMDGIAAASTIRDRFGIPIIYLTAHGDDTTITQAKKTFPLGYLLKPISERELRITVEIALQNHEMRRSQAPEKGLQDRVELSHATAAAAQSMNPRSARPGSSRSLSPGWNEARRILSIGQTLFSEAIQEQLHKIVSSKILSQSKRLVRFLSLVVEMGLDGEGGQINEYLIGVEVYERPSSFDPQLDTIVRTEARRLRSKLRQYYDTEGAHDRILIEIPKGSYAPAFRERERGILDKEPGQVISHYRLLKKLGEGGMGVVYLAEDTQLGRPVALKFIHGDRLKQKHAKLRLIREARAAAAIDHPNVAGVYEVSEVEGHAFVAMAYIKGIKLEDRILEGLLKIEDALDIGRQLADGLEAAHRQGVVHRDLNPSNAILGDDGRVRIVDFGVAKLSFASRLTDSGTLIGTANYVSPEQMKGEAVDHRTDIWSLGVILYELLTGKRPFEGDHREAVYYAITHKIPEPMSRLQVGIPEELERIVFKCLEKEPANRYSDVTALKVDLLKAQPDVARAQDRSSTTFPLPLEVAQESEVKGGSQVQLKSLVTTGGESGSTPAEGATAQSAKSAETRTQEQLSSGTRPGGRLHFPGLKGTRIVGVIFVALLVLAGSIWWLRTTQQQQPREASTAASIPRLAVLPFESRTPGEENQALSYAISDSLISKLTKLRGLQVPSWTSVIRLTERKATLSEIANILKVQYVLEGSLLRSGDEGHIAAQLIRVSDDSHVWSEQFDFPWKDLLKARQKISESVIRQMNIQLQPEEDQLLAQGSTKNVKAYQAHARGRYSMVRFSYSREPSYLIEAENYFKRALEEDPQYANSLADLAYVCYQRIYPPQGDRKELAAKGISYAERALAIAPNHLVALYILGSLYDHMGEVDKGLDFCQKAVQLGPNDPEAHHHLAWRYLERGFWESGVEENSIAIAKDTLFMDPYFYKITFLTRLGKYEEALAAANQLEEVEPASSYPGLVRGDIAFFQGDLARAEAGWRKVMEMAPKRFLNSDLTSLLLATISARKGQVEEGRRVLQDSEKVFGRVTDYPIKLAALVGEKDLAINLIRDSLINRNYRWLVSDPDIASLRNEPRFQELLYELYQKWQHDLAALGPSLPVRPPTLPTPEEYLSRRVR